MLIRELKMLKFNKFTAGKTFFPVNTLLQV